MRGIEDAVRAYDLVSKHNELLTEPVNFGNGKEIPIIDLANTIIELCGKKGIIKPSHVEPKPAEVKS
ncbi:unnamed protein product [marine sediment metagenome]|uniref:Uncharacterized protein n=1 Tax=marine sediment metagenome TaxID=412755 RepID=X1KT89_9ZZZZ